MEDTRLPKCVMFGEMVGGAGCVGGQEKEWMGRFLDDLRAFGINADQWTTAVQDEGVTKMRLNACFDEMALFGLFPGLVKGCSSYGRNGGQPTRGDG